MSHYVKPHKGAFMSIKRSTTYYCYRLWFDANGARTNGAMTNGVRTNGARTNGTLPEPPREIWKGGTRLFCGH